MTDKRFTVEEMQNWNKRYKLDKETAKCVIDTFDGGEYWTVHGNEAYNLCIDMNALSDENEELKKEAEEYNEDAMSYQTLYEQQLKKSEELLSECSHQQKQRMKLYIENIELKQSNERLLKMLDNVANYMQKQNKYMSIPDFVEWWNGIATKGLDDGDVE